MSSLTIRIPDALRRDLKKLSRQRRQPISHLVRDSIRRYVAVERLAELRKEMVPLAEKQGILTDEDVFKAVS